MLHYVNWIKLEKYVVNILKSYISTYRYCHAMALSNCSTTAKEGYYKHYTSNRNKKYRGSLDVHLFQHVLNFSELQFEDHANGEHRETA